MLLPSALPCDGGNYHQDAVAQRRRPLLRRFMPFSRLPSSSSSGANALLPTLSIMQESSVVPPVVDATCASGLPSPLLSPASISSGIHSTCRALQAFLGVAPSATKPAKSPSRQNQIQFPLTPDLPYTPKALSSAKDHHYRVSKRSSPVRPSLPSRGKNKRRRDDYETCESMDIDVQNSSTHGYGYSFDSGYAESGSSASLSDTEYVFSEKCFSTPKRRRRFPGPVNIPFGLDRQDFADLESANNELATLTQRATMVTTSPRSDRVFESCSLLDTPISPPDEDDETEEWWTPLDDAHLVTTVLEKMNLSRRDWEECARVLGAKGEGGSLGKRWKWLMEEGKIGLKMGVGEGGRFEGRRGRRRQVRGDVRKVF